MAVIQSYNREGAFRKQFCELNRANQRSNQHAQNLSSLFFPAIELFGVIATVAVLALGSRLYEDGTLTLGTLIAFIGLLSLLFQPLQELSELYGQVQSAAAAMEKITTRARRARPTSRARRTPAASIASRATSRSST